MARLPPEVSMMVKTAGDLMHKVKLDSPPTRVMVDRATIRQATTDPAVRDQLKALMHKGVKLAPSLSGRIEHNYIPPVKQSSSQFSRPLSGYRLRDLKPEVLSQKVYCNPRPRPLRGVVATVFGGTGFLGRQLIVELAKYGATIVVPVRVDNSLHPACLNTKDYRYLKCMGDQGQIVPVVYDPTIFEELSRLVERSQVVFNCIGAPHAQINQSFSFGIEAVYHNLPRLIARACQMRGVQRLVHTSHINANLYSDVPFFKYKAMGEEAVLEEFPNAIIIRPADLFGEFDSFTNWIWMKNRTSNWPLYSSSTYLLKGNEYVECQPVWVTEVARGMVRAAMREYAFGQTYQLAGPTKYKLIEVMRFIEAIKYLMPSHVRLYTPTEVKLRFENRPGCEDQMTWIDLHLRESVIPKPGVLSWTDLELDPAQLTKLEDICGDWCSRAPYRVVPTGYDEDCNDPDNPRMHGQNKKRIILMPLFALYLFITYGIELAFP